MISTYTEAIKANKLGSAVVVGAEPVGPSYQDPGVKEAMTSYFDSARREVHDLPRDMFIQGLIDIERRVAHEVSLVTGDREFPDDLREKIQGIIAVKSVHALPDLPPNGRMKEDALCCYSSTLLENLHSAFHELARRGVVTRFGRMLDSPRGILHLRDEYDKERGHLPGLL